MNNRIIKNMLIINITIFVAYIILIAVTSMFYSSILKMNEQFNIEREISKDGKVLSYTINKDDINTNEELFMILPSCFVSRSEVKIYEKDCIFNQSELYNNGFDVVNQQLSIYTLIVNEGNSINVLEMDIEEKEYYKNNVFLIMPKKQMKCFVFLYQYMVPAIHRLNIGFCVFSFIFITLSYFYMKIRDNSKLYIALYVFLFLVFLAGVELSSFIDFSNIIVQKIFVFIKYLAISAAFIGLSYKLNSIILKYIGITNIGIVLVCISLTNNLESYARTIYHLKYYSVFILAVLAYETYKKIKMKDINIIIFQNVLIAIVFIIIDIIRLEKPLLVAYNTTFYGYYSICVLFSFIIIEEFVSKEQKIAAESERYMKLYYQAVRDDLTKLYSKSYLMRVLENELPIYYAVMIDVDRFKQINDMYGHIVGDEIIVKVASLVKKEISKQDFAARYGGDELFVILRGKTIDKVDKIIKTINEKAKENITTTKGVKIKVGLSVGVYRVAFNESVSAIVDKADRAMYQSKQNKEKDYTLFK